jgi:hypothetical protein
MKPIVKRTLKLAGLIIGASGILMFGMYVHERSLLFFGAGNINSSRYFPDPVFRQEVERYMGVKSGQPFSEYQASNRIGNLYLNFKSMVGAPIASNLKGIEYLKSLEEFNCSNNSIKEIDLRENINLLTLSLSDISIGKILFPEGAKLESLSLNNIQYKPIDLSIFPNLQRLELENCGLKTLDLSPCPWLLELSCSSNQLSILDLSKTPKLQRLICDGNLLTSLDVTPLKDLLFLSCAKNQISALDVSQNTYLCSVYCMNNQIKKINIGAIQEVKNIDCSFNQIDNIKNFLTLPWLSTFSVEQNDLDKEDAADVLSIKTQMEKLASESANQYIRITFTPQKSADPYVLPATP